MGSGEGGSDVGSGGGSDVGSGEEAVTWGREMQGREIGGRQ